MMQTFLEQEGFNNHETDFVSHYPCVIRRWYVGAIARERGSRTTDADPTDPTDEQSPGASATRPAIAQDAV